MEAAEQTNYPEIFKGTYWSKGGKATPSIIRNRNKLVEDFNIKESGYSDGMPPEIRTSRAYDHPEFYTIKGSGETLLVLSPYSGRIKDVEELKNKYGLIEIPPVYHETAKSFVLKFSP